MSQMSILVSLEVLNKMSRSAKTAKKNQWRLIKSLLLVTVVFNVSWTPYSITVILDYKVTLPYTFTEIDISSKI